MPSHGLVHSFKIQIKQSIEQLRALTAEKDALADTSDGDSLKNKIRSLTENIKKLQNSTQVKARIRKANKRKARIQRIRRKKAQKSTEIPKPATIPSRRTKIEKIAADILSQKEQDVLKTIKKLELLKKLRNLRANLHAGSSSSQDTTFDDKTHILEAFWRNALAEIKKQKAASAPELPVEEQWSNVLFGEPPEHAENVTFDKLLEIRSTWDSYLVGPDEPSGSSIPVGWVLPVEAALSDWKQFRK